MLGLNKDNAKRLTVLVSTSVLIIMSLAFYYFYNGKLKEDKLRRAAFKVMYRKANDLREFERERLVQQFNTARPVIKNYDLMRLNMWGLPILVDSVTTTDTLMKDDIVSTYRSKLKELNEKEIDFGDEQTINYPLSLFLPERLLQDSSINYLIDLPDVYKLNKKRFEGYLTGFFSEYYFSDFDHTIYPRGNLTLRKSLKTIKIDSLFYNASDTLSPSVKLGILSKNGGFGVDNKREIQQEVEIYGEKYQVFIVPINGIKLSYLIGLISTEKYNAKKRAFDRTLISIILFIVLVLVFSLPFLKLSLVTPGEAFTIRSLTILIISSGVLLFILSYSAIRFTNKYYVQQHIQQKNGHLDSISNQMQAAFSHEVDSMHTALKKFKADIHQNLDKSKRNIESNWKSVDNYKMRIDSFNRLNDYSYKYWKEAFVVNTDPATRRYFSYNKTTLVLYNTRRYSQLSDDEGIDVSMRDYVKNPSRFMLGTDSIGFESIFSLSSLEPEAIISTKDTANNVILCLSSEMTSINKVILPYGYSFCIVDKEGKVWFHKDPINNLRENLLEETDNDPQLITTLESGQLKVIECDYKLAKTMFHIRPLRPDLGLSLVVMCKVNDHNQIVNQSGYMLIGGIIVVFLFWMLLAFLFRWYTYIKRPSDFEANGMVYFFFNPEYGSVYKKLLIFNSVIAGLAILFAVFLHGIVYASHWFRLVALVGGLMLLWNMCVLRSKAFHLNRNANGGVLLFAFLFMLITEFFFANKSADYHWGSLLICGAVLSAFWGVLWLFNNVVSFKDATEGKCSLGVYKVYLGSLIGGLVIIPMFVFYMSLFHQELTLYQMHQLRFVADQYMAKYNQLKKEVGDDANLKFKLLNEGNYVIENHGIVIDNSSGAVGKIQEANLFKLATENYLDVFGEGRAYMFYINNAIEDRGNATKPAYFDSNDKVYVYSTHKGKMHLNVRQKGGTFNYPKDFNVSMAKVCLSDIPMRYLGFLFAIIIVALLLDVMIPLVGRFLFPQMKYKFDIVIDRDIQGDAIYCVGIGNNAYLSRKKKEHVHWSAIWNRYYWILSKSSIDLNLENFIFKKLSSLEKLVDFLEHFKANLAKGKKICVYNNKVPTFWIKEVKQLMDEIPETNTKESNKRKELMMRLECVLSAFQLRFRKLDARRIDFSKVESLFSREDKYSLWLRNNFDWIQQEFIGAAREEYQMKHFYKGLAKDKKFYKQALIYKLYVLNYSYYKSIWNGCTDREKSVLYDIAEDFVINLQKEDIVPILLNKGLVVGGAFLRLFNNGFTHFVRKQKEEVLEINEQLIAQNKGGWGQISLPIKLLAASVIVFLFIVNQDFLTNIQSIVISVGAILSFAMRFFKSPIKSPVVSDA